MLTGTYRYRGWELSMNRLRGTTPSGQIYSSRRVPCAHGRFEHFPGRGRQCAPSVLGHEFNDPEKPARATGDSQRELRVGFLDVRRDILEVSERHNSSLLRIGVTVRRRTGIIPGTKFHATGVPSNRFGLEQFHHGAVHRQEIVAEGRCSRRAAFPRCAGSP